MAKKVLVVGGSGFLGSHVADELTEKGYEVTIFDRKKSTWINDNQKFIESDLLDREHVIKSLEGFNFVIHFAGIADIGESKEKPLETIETNIIGTANITKICSQLKIKLIYISTSYVYPGNKGNYKETDPIYPINNYALSKMGGEASVRMYDNSLTIRASMTEKPFIHNEAFSDFVTNFMYHEDLAKNLLKLINKKGIINVGGQKQSVYRFAKKSNKKIESISARKKLGNNYPLKQSMNVRKYFKLIRN